jgi:hypothetical protein
MDHYIHWLVDFISLFAILFLFYQYVFSLYREKKSNVSTIVFFDKWNIIEEKKNYTLSQTNIIGHSTDISVTLGYQTYRKTCNVREKKGRSTNFFKLKTKSTFVWLSYLTWQKIQNQPRQNLFSKQDENTLIKLLNFIRLFWFKLFIPFFSVVYLTIKILIWSFN